MLRGLHTWVFVCIAFLRGDNTNTLHNLPTIFNLEKMGKESCVNFGLSPKQYSPPRSDRPFFSRKSQKPKLDLTLLGTRWGTSSYKWSYTPDKWPYKMVSDGFWVLFPYLQGLQLHCQLLGAHLVGENKFLVNYVCTQSPKTTDVSLTLWMETFKARLNLSCQSGF